MIRFGEKKFYQDVYTSGVNAWTNPGVTEVEIILVGGGGGGGGSDGNTTASGGGSGLVVKRKVAISGNLTATVGAGGSGGYDGAEGADGGDSSITDGVVTVTAYGGRKGSYRSSYQTFGGAGMQPGEDSNQLYSGRGGSNEYGVGGRPVTNSGGAQNGAGGSGYGAGGSGSYGDNKTGGGGTGGLCIIGYYL